MSGKPVQILKIEPEHELVFRGKLIEYVHIFEINDILIAFYNIK